MLDARRQHSIMLRVAAKMLDELTLLKEAPCQNQSRSNLKYQHASTNDTHLVSCITDSRGADCKLSICFREGWRVEHCAVQRVV